MEHDTSLQAALAVSIALAAGMIAQSLAQHLRVPGIVLLLGVGVLLGPDVAGLVRPTALGPALPVLVGFAVAVILFEGGMNLSLQSLRSQARVIQRLITIGALVTAIGGTLVARLVMGWDWGLAILFGSLVVVTGPTVITPLLRQIRVTHKVETVLMAEGVLIDAVGAVLAVVTLEVVLSFSAESVADGFLGVLTRLGLGMGFGLIAGLAIAVMLRFKKVVPDGFENVLTLSIVLAVFQISNALLPESGIMTVTVAGMVVGNFRTRVLRDLMEFKEQLTLMFIGLLFVLLAADVRVDDVLGLGWAGVAAVAALMFLVRPINIWVSTAGSDLSGREKAFLSWLAPRGVVAAAVASLFAQTLATAGNPGGSDLRALVFMVIAGTVVVQGLSGGFVARLLGVHRGEQRGFVILGANEIGRLLARLLVERGIDVTLVDNNPSAVRAAEESGLQVIYGNIIETRTQERAGMDDRQGGIAATSNEEVNLIFANTAARDYGQKEIYIALRQTQISVHMELVEESGAEVLFGRQRDIELWMVRLRRSLTVIECWTFGEGAERTEGDEADAASDAGPFDFPEHLLLPLIVTRSGKAHPVGHQRPFKRGDNVQFLVVTEKRDDATAWLGRHGWSKTSDDAPDLAPEAARQEQAT